VNAALAIQLALKLADLATLAITDGGKAKSEYETLRAKLETFQSENRDPTADEFRALAAETTALSNRLDAAANRLG